MKSSYVLICLIGFWFCDASGQSNASGQSVTDSRLIEWESPYKNQILLDEDPSQQNWSAQLSLPNLIPLPSPPSNQVQYARKFADQSLAFTAHPLPLIMTTLGANVALTVTNLGEASATLSQSLLSARDIPTEITVSETQTFTWVAEWSGASTYTIRRNREIWVGVIVVLPSSTPSSNHSLQDLASVYTLNLSTTQSQADTRRAQPWSWQLEQNTPRFARVNQALSSMGTDLNPYRIEWNHTLALVNVSDVPIALDIPSNIYVHGSIENTDPKPGDVNRVPIEDTRGPLHILPPGQGCLMWSHQAIQNESILAFGYTALGGRSWVPTRMIAQVSTAGLTSLPSAEQLSTLTPPQVLTQFPMIANPSHSQKWSLPTKYTWAYQGSHRSQYWKMTGHVPTYHIQDDWGLWEIRNISSRAHSFASNLGPHYQLDPQSLTWRIRSSSWVTIRDRFLIAIPHGLHVGNWKVGVLYSGEAEQIDGLQKAIRVIP